MVCATLPAPPCSATKRPPVRSAARTLVVTARGRVSQWSAAFEKTQSNWPTEKSCPSPTHELEMREPCAGLFDHVAVGVEADHRRAPLGDLRRELSRAAPEVEHPFAGLRIEQVDQRIATAGHETELIVVVAGIPRHRAKSNTSEPRELARVSARESGVWPVA